MSELARLLDARSEELIEEWARRHNPESVAPSDAEAALRLHLTRVLGELASRLHARAHAGANPGPEHSQSHSSARHERAQTELDIGRHQRQYQQLREVLFDAAESAGIPLSLTEMRIVTGLLSDAASNAISERVATAGIGLWEFDVSARAITCDQRAVELTGIETNAWLHLDAWLLDLPFASERAGIARALAAAAEAGEGSCCEVEFRTRGKDAGEVRWLEARACAAAGQDGRVLRLAGVMLDITARKQTEEQVRAKTAWLNLLLDNTKDYAVILSTVDRKVVEWQGGAAAITGYSAAEMVGLSADMIFTETERVAGMPEKEATAALRDGRAEDKRWHVRKDGSRFFADGVMTPLYDSAGNLNGFGKVFRDATAQKQAEDALRWSDERLHFALRAGRMGTWDLNLESNAFTASDTCKANYGRSPTDPFAYDDMVASVLDDDRVMWLDKVEAAIAACKDLDVEFRVRWPDDSVHWVHVRASCTTEEERATALSGISTSIDDRKAIEEELRAADRRKDEFLSTASHELRTPLNAILGWASMLRAGRLDPDASRQASETIERNARAQVKLIEDILDGSRIITGKLRLEVRPLDMTELVAAAVDAIRPAAEAKHIRLAVRVDPTAARVVGDPDRLQQVVWNLATNAIKFTPRAGEVEISLRRVDNSVELRVRDTGQGIEPDFLPHVFERFRQADGSTTRRYGGLGLGLALVRHLVDAHGGTVRAESPGESKGSTFIVTLPVQAVYAAPPTLERPARAAPQANLAGVTALVVDDEPDARDLVAAVLRLSGAEVRTAANAEDALAQIAEQRPMVLLSDIGMPLMDGYAFMRRVRESVEGSPSSLPAIALTAYAREEDRRLALAAGFQVHVAKPVDPVDLVRAVANLTVGHPPAPP